ncbi:MAG: hypothetical protein J5711_06970 [Bacteroidales bacterium]|nr:hypothetical protein [Bacteroidales bacterium]
MKRFEIIVLVMLMALVGCNPASRPGKANFQVSYQPLLDGILYPSLILGYNNYSGNDEFDLFEARLTPPTDNSVMRIVIDSSALNYETEIQETLGKHGNEYSVVIRPKWKYDVLRNLRQPGPIDLTFSCYLDDERVGVRNLHLTYRSVNECLLSVRDTSGELVDFKWMFCAYVNEDHTEIDSMLAEMLDQGVVNRFTGYQTKANTPQQQVRAIWYYALNRGITYSSITCTANPSKRSSTQHIRFFDEVYRYRQANCVDACVFFASIMRRIGLKPVIFVEPCHAYLGYYTDKNRKNIALLETTLTGWVNFPELERSVDSTGCIAEKQWAKVSKYLTEKQQEDYLNGKSDLETLKHQVADALFDKATNYDVDDYNSNQKYFQDPTNNQYRELDIEKLRQLVQPIQ